MNPPFEIELTELARTKLRKLETPTRDRIVRKLKQAAENPARSLERLSSVESYKLRVGDYRVIVDIDWDRRVLFVLTLGHRSVIYG